MNRRLINKNIDIVNELVINEDILYLSDVSNLSALKEDKRLTEIISRDIATSMEIRSFLYIVKSIPGVSSVVKMFYRLQKIKENSQLKESKYMIEKGKIIAEIESVLRDNLNENDFVQELNKTISESGYTQSQLADKASIEHTYPNKILNKKLPPGSTVSRDIIIKIALALGMDLSETNNLMARAGYILCGQNQRDVVICICLENNGILITTNEILYERGHKILQDKQEIVEVKEIFGQPMISIVGLVYTAMKHRDMVDLPKGEPQGL